MKFEWALHLIKEDSGKSMYRTSQPKREIYFENDKFWEEGVNYLQYYTFQQEDFSADDWEVRERKNIAQSVELPINADKINKIICNQRGEEVAKEMKKEQNFKCEQRIKRMQERMKEYEDRFYPQDGNVADLGKFTNNTITDNSFLGGIKHKGGLEGIKVNEDNKLTENKECKCNGDCKCGGDCKCKDKKNVELKIWVNGKELEVTDNMKEMFDELVEMQKHKSLFNRPLFPRPMFPFMW